MSNPYPPGVTGNEYQIVGPDSETEGVEFCNNCQEDTEGVVITSGHERWFHCDHCQTTTTLDDRDEET